MVQIAAIISSRGCRSTGGCVEQARLSPSPSTLSRRISCFHVQVGPFPRARTQSAMRQKLLADGYNAIIK